MNTENGFEQTQAGLANLALAASDGTKREQTP
jgi:hypothetical protein